MFIHLYDPFDILMLYMHFFCLFISLFIVWFLFLHLLKILSLPSRSSGKLCFVMCLVGNIWSFLICFLTVSGIDFALAQKKCVTLLIWFGAASNFQLKWFVHRRYAKPIRKVSVGCFQRIKTHFHPANGRRSSSVAASFCRQYFGAFTDETVTFIGIPSRSQFIFFKIINDSSATGLIEQEFLLEDPATSGTGWKDFFCKIQWITNQERRFVIPFDHFVIRNDTELWSFRDHFTNSAFSALV